MVDDAAQASAQLTLMLYELRRDERWRAAWGWFATSFFPDSVGDIKAVMDPAHAHSADFRAVTSYWDMAAAFAVSGAVSAEHFMASADEMMRLWVRMADHVEPLRRDLALPGFLSNVEKVAALAPGQVEQARKLDEPNLRRHVVRAARGYLASGWLCSKHEQEAILSDYEAVCLNTQLGIASICNLENAARHVINKRLRGAFVECGTWRGGALAYWARSFMRNGGDAAATALYGFDSFEGMPRMTAVDGERASQWLYGKRLSEVRGRLTDGALVATGANVTGEAECRELVENTGYPKEAIHIIKGWFQDTLPRYRGEVGAIAVLRLDADLYEATRYCLESFYDSVVSHGLVIIDDYEYFEGCRRAVDEFVAARELNLDLIYFGDFGRCFFKP